VAKFPSDEWVRALMDEINRSQAYEQAARNWEGDFYFIVEPEGGLDETVYLYMDLWHGKCREAFLASDPAQKDPVFRMSAKAGIWRKVVEKELDPIRGLLTRQIQLRGNMSMIMKNVKAAQELVECCTRVPTEFPEGV
jgi:putative sterol carrier protein